LNTIRRIGAIACAAAMLLSVPLDACTRFIYRTGSDSFIVGRSMDWAEDPGTDLWSFPHAMERDGGVGEGSIKWTSKYGSVISSFYNLATVEGMNDAGLVANTLYLVESDYGDAKASGKPLISVGAWTQYVLDNFSTVAEAVDALAKEPFAIVAPALPGGRKAGGHLSIADASGDSAIFEYIGGKLVIHHDPKYTVMTNSPTFGEQLAIESYWRDVNGLTFLPGTIGSADRFVRMSWLLGAEREGSPPRRRNRVLSDPRGLRAAWARRSQQAEHRRDDLADGFRSRCRALLFRIRLQPDDLLGRYKKAEARAGFEAKPARS
jgi:penicillin V acylase-like amidase (Ntn superfamily)